MKTLFSTLSISFIFTASSFIIKNKTVYICDSKSSYAYHFDSNCRGLNRCSHQIIEMSEQQAQQTRKLCGWED